MPCYTLIYPYITYCNSTWSSTYVFNLNIIYYLQKQAVRVITNSDYRALHNIPLFSKLEFEIFSKSVRIRSILLSLCFATTKIRCLHSSLICLWQTDKSIDMTQEQPVIIECIPVVLTSRNSQFFTKDLKSGTVFLHLLQTCQAFLSLRTKC